ncbi:MAG: NAD(P)H-dependent oxidoreductase [Paramuribaculum sp.]|nr:NAD(P)H-dependent oxidoreductase [Paramuribaculum sp.]
MKDDIHDLIEKVYDADAVAIACPIYSGDLGAYAKAFIELINSYMQRKDENEVIFVEGTGHVYTKREQMLADIILSLVRKWQ